MSDIPPQDINMRHLTGTGQAPSGGLDQGFVQRTGSQSGHDTAQSSGPMQWERPAGQLGDSRNVATFGFPISPFTPLPSDPSTSQRDPFYAPGFDPLPSQSDPFVGTPSQPWDYYPMVSQEYEMQYSTAGTPSPLGPYSGYAANGFLDPVYAAQLFQQSPSEQQPPTQSGPDHAPAPHAEADSQGPPTKDRKGKKRERSGSAIATAEKAESSKQKRKTNASASSERECVVCRQRFENGKQLSAHRRKCATEIELLFKDETKVRFTRAPDASYVCYCDFNPHGHTFQNNESFRRHVHLPGGASRPWDPKGVFAGLSEQARSKCGSTALVLSGPSVPVIPTSRTISNGQASTHFRSLARGPGPSDESVPETPSMTKAQGVQHTASSKRQPGLTARMKINHDKGAVQDAGRVGEPQEDNPRAQSLGTGYASRPSSPAESVIPEHDESSPTCID
ncbi:hypothetical protein PUNSTDRAFT_139657 [Punctularia strigosozonata HHB-11173 SS5]|uniref:Uncharacterized protein n=1 Tax=Punctularia strigosozonata (strain HHB-11173) TaxID=741275 RepID=R7S0J9_PUNST|nr:uncharacterized protein PUNSTDRAFT_139657 [Punctularia strigosozonata HHB-11173 SS5]EIN03327.1 hypothetical protein PUNSTDRAFT_139657 [Punctularia strigosozonata HHB-11173 SS5]